MIQTKRCALTKIKNIPANLSTTLVTRNSVKKKTGTERNFLNRPKLKIGLTKLLNI
jgi:hypothetical protein